MLLVVLLAGLAVYTLSLAWFLGRALRAEDRRDRQRAAMWLMGVSSAALLGLAALLVLA